MRKFKFNKKGFTLVELVVVIAILAVIAAVATTSTMAILDNSRKSAVETDAKAIGDCWSNYMISDNGVGKVTFKAFAKEGEYVVDTAKRESVNGASCYIDTAGWAGGDKNVKYTAAITITVKNQWYTCTVKCNTDGSYEVGTGKKI